MFPILFSISDVSVSTFAVFITLAFLFGVFTIWRLSRAWDFDEEKALDLTVLTFIGAIIVSRLYFVSEHLGVFMRAPLSIVLIYKIPGFSFWGGFLGGWLTLYLLCRRQKLDFWHIADLASVAFLGSLIFADLGCFFGGCDIGVRSNVFFAMKVVGQAQKTIPVSVIEAVLIYFSFVKIWPLVTHFHSRGYVVGVTFITLGAIKIILEPLRQIHSAGSLFSATLLVLGLFIFYKSTGRNFLLDLKRLPLVIARFFTHKETRLAALQFFQKWWYNQKALWIWRAHSIKKSIRKVNARSN